MQPHILKNESVYPKLLATTENFSFLNQIKMLNQKLQRKKTIGSPPVLRK